MLLSYNDRFPKVAQDVFIASGAKVIGDTEIGEGSSVWFNTVIRGDVHSIKVGSRTNIQDLTMVHAAAGAYPTFIGNEVTIGHNALIHACRIGNRCLIGMGSIVMDGAVIGDDCIVGAGSVVTKNTVVPAGCLVLGTPAKIVREIYESERVWILQSAENYYQLAKQYQNQAFS